MADVTDGTSHTGGLYTTLKYYSYFSHFPSKRGIGDKATIADPHVYNYFICFLYIFIMAKRHCCVPFCKSDSRYLNKKTKTDPGQDNEDIHFHRIPKDFVLRKQKINLLVLFVILKVTIYHEHLTN